MMNLKVMVIIFSTSLIISNIKTSLAIQKNSRNKSYMEGKVVGGVEVSISMYPHIVSIGLLGYVICGGSIIADRVVLTAAHCLQVQEHQGFSLSPTDLEIYAGSSISGKGQKYKICRVLKHPKYRENISLNYDIGLVFTTKPFKYSTVIQKVSIASNENWKNSRSKFEVAGFGITSTHGVALAKHLGAVHLSYVDSETCEKSQSRLGYTLRVPRHGFCLIGRKWAGDCMGDSGSGVVWKNYIVGVVSSARDKYCGSDMTPSSYMNAVYFKKWITSEINKFNPRTCKKNKSG